jgi:hypothetical protein
MAGIFKMLALALSGVFVILFALLFITGLGRSKGYKFFVAEVAMLGSVAWATSADMHFKFFDLPFLLPFMGSLVLLLIGSILFARAVFAEQVQGRQESGPPLQTQKVI